MKTRNNMIMRASALTLALLAFATPALASEQSSRVLLDAENPSTPFSSVPPDEVVAVSSTGETMTAKTAREISATGRESAEQNIDGTGQIEDLGVEGTDWWADEPPLEEIAAL